MMLKTYFPFMCPRLSTPEDAQFFGPAVQLFVNRLCDALSPYILRRDSRLIASSNMSGLYVTLSITTHDIYIRREREREHKHTSYQMHESTNRNIQRKVYKVHDLLLYTYIIQIDLDHVTYCSGGPSSSANIFFSRTTEPIFSKFGM